MKRFEINVGDDFPVGENGRPRFGRCGDGRGMMRRGRFGLLGVAARGFFFLALAIIIVRHPVHSAIILGVLLLAERFSLLRRQGRGWRAPWRGAGRRWHSDADRGAYV